MSTATTPTCGHCRATSAARRCGAATSWALPAAILALLPKCPMCVAAYLATATGASVSIAAASRLRWAILLTCAAALLLLTAAALRRHRRASTRSGCPG